MAAAAVLTREKDFEDLLGTGRSFFAPDRQYTQLVDDLAFPRMYYSVQELKDAALRAQQKRRFWEDLSTAAGAAGVPVSTYAYAQGAHKEEVPETTDLVSTNHDEAALVEGLHREAQQNQREAAHEDRRQAAGALWEGGHDQPTTMGEILRKNTGSDQLPTARPGPAEGAIGAAGKVGGAVIGATRTGTGMGHDAGMHAGAGVGKAVGKGVDTVGEHATSFLGKVKDAVVWAVTPDGLEWDSPPPEDIPKKLKESPVAHRPRRDLRPKRGGRDGLR